MSRCYLTFKRGEIKKFKLWLNYQYSGQTYHRNGKYAQRKREYGDYLYAQDREKFMVELSHWLALQH